VCRANVDPAARGALASLLGDMAAGLAEVVGCRPEDISIGPGDFGDDQQTWLASSATTPE